MIVKQLIQVLESHSEFPLQISLPSGEFVPEHFHVTEVGRVQKTFIDCGGTRRESVACVIQVWTAQDVAHRLSAGKLVKILKMASSILGPGDLPVEVEYGADAASQYVLADIDEHEQGLRLVLNGKQTNCLASDKCGVSECSGSGCC